MRFKRGVNSEEAAKFLGLDLPTELRLLKSAYRKRSLILHPDVGGSAAGFRDLEEAYRCLVDSPDVLKKCSDEIVQRTVCGRLLSELGGGYPLSVSAKMCSNCEGAGYRILREPRMKDCEACHGTGWKHLKCNRCGGTGDFKRGGKVVGKCYGCKGTGEFVPHYWAEDKRERERKQKKSPFHPFDYGRQSPPSHYCNECDMAGRVYVKDEASYAVMCDECEGLGELKMFNPVLPRALLAEVRR